MAARIDILSLDSIKSIIHNIISGKKLRESSLSDLYNIVKEKKPSLIGKQIIDADIKQILTSMQAEAVALEAKTIITENIEKLEQKLKEKYPEHQVSNKQLKANLSKLNITDLRKIKDFLASQIIHFDSEIMEKIIPGFKELTRMKAEAEAKANKEANTIITENIQKLEQKLKETYPEHQISNEQLKANLSKLNITVLREIKQFLASKRIYFGHEIMEKIIPGFKKREEELIREQEKKEEQIKGLIPKIKKTYPNYNYTKNKNQNENQLKRNLEKLDTVRLSQIYETLEKGIELDHVTQQEIFRGFSQSQYKTKYHKYKMKYLELKKKINSSQL